MAERWLNKVEEEEDNIYMDMEDKENSLYMDMNIIRKDVHTQELEADYLEMEYFKKSWNIHFTLVFMAVQF